jgi:hypothetical protein
MWCATTSTQARVTVAWNFCGARCAQRAVRAELRADPRVSLRPGSSDWLTVEFHSQEDERFVVSLFEAAAAAHRPADGSTVTPPPKGADLARRRCFH